MTDVPERLSWKGESETMKSQVFTAYPYEHVAHLSERGIDLGEPVEVVLASDHDAAIRNRVAPPGRTHGKVEEARLRV